MATVKEFKFKIGDTIKVTNTSVLYSRRAYHLSLEKMAEQLGADIGGKWNYAYHNNIKGQTGFIKNIATNSINILIELNSGTQWIIGHTGIEKIDIILPDSLFEI